LARKKKQLGNMRGEMGGMPERSLVAKEIHRKNVKERPEKGRTIKLALGLGATKVNRNELSSNVNKNEQKHAKIGVRSEGGETYQERDE